MEPHWSHQYVFTSNTLFQKMKKKCTTKNFFKAKYKKRQIWQRQIEFTWRLWSNSNRIFGSKKVPYSQEKKKRKPHFRTTTKATTKQQQQQQLQHQRQQLQQRRQQQHQQHSKQGSSEWWYSQLNSSIVLRDTYENICRVIKKTRPATSKIDKNNWLKLF